MRPFFPTVSPSKRRLFPQRLLILHSLHSPRAKGEIFAPLFSTTCTLFFTLGKKTTRHLASFQSLPHSLQEYRGTGPHPHQNTPTSQPRLGQRRVLERSAPTPASQANWIWSLLAIRYVFISSHRYFVPSPGETLSDALSSYGEEIPNPSL